MCLCHQAVNLVLVRRWQCPVILDGNHRSGIALAMCHDFNGLSIHRLMAYERQISTLLRSRYGTLYLYKEQLLSVRWGSKSTHRKR